MYDKAKRWSWVVSKSERILHFLFTISIKISFLFNPSNKAHIFNWSVIFELGWSLCRSLSTSSNKNTKFEYLCDYSNQYFLLFGVGDLQTYLSLVNYYLFQIDKWIPFENSIQVSWLLMSMLPARKVIRLCEVSVSLELHNSEIVIYIQLKFFHDLHQQ